MGLSDRFYVEALFLWRQKLLFENIEQQKIILIDRDGVINIRAPVNHYITHPDDFILISDTVDSMRALSKLGFGFIVITNQAGIGRGLFTFDDLKHIHEKMMCLLAENDISILDVYSCPHVPNDGCECRKPKPGMLFQAAEQHNISLSECLFIGDDPRDVIAAKNAKTGSVLINCSDQERITSGVMPMYFAPKLSQLLTHIKSFYQVV
jgi:D-glycero-D-manno-heptose 1,7-bisphosphate phosphatase